ncbi:mechanosensitive ion channel family protein [Croceicoccus bisphenolivorans]|uniref:mechanosensitive ion channel family protein n=1 Tax=Croceicoccus bisphenolivorans TaxID=1783232 RepID=UPI0008358484|nr:mechanosensitive ion channel domain-containing protein [Croceicoccus bisphenolivorans]
MDKLTDLFASQPGPMREVAVAVLAAAIAIIVALAAHRVIFKILRRVARGSGNTTDDVVVRKLARPSRYAFIALGLVLAAREIPALDDIWEKIAGFVMPALVGWMAMAIMHAFIHAMTERADITVPDNRQARRKRTRLAIFSRIGTALIIFITVGLMLLSIPGVRDIGVTLMASAGLAGLAVGAAAQPALKSLIAGLQMAITEPIAIDDVVIVDGEWGRIEDIKTTYVVVKIWDERRLVVPTTKFLEETFQNWTKRGAQLLGSVMLYVDPVTDVAPIRAEFERRIANHPLFDGRVQNVQVTDVTPQAMEVRLLLSARNSQDLWDLRVAIREAMMDWLRKEIPDAIVRQRIEPSGPLAIAQSPAQA